MDKILFHIYIETHTKRGKQGKKGKKGKKRGKKRKKQLEIDRRKRKPITYT